MKQLLLLICLTFNWSTCSVAASNNDEKFEKWQNLIDFMVQDICVDEHNQVLAGISPFNLECTRHRNLLPNELLTYHKHDWPNSSDIKSTQGYQISDSYPVTTNTLGPLIIQTFDFGSAEQQFGQFDTSDGGQIIAFSNFSAAIIATEDGGGGMQLFASEDCKEHVKPQSLLNSWVISDDSSVTMSSGNLIANLRITKTQNCPKAFDKSYTEWHFKEFKYNANADHPETKQLLTLVSSHFGGDNKDLAPHLERFYFTRELGWTRWERWQNFDASKDLIADVSRSIRFRETNRCQLLEAAPEGNWGLLDCREWTNIKPSSNLDGDLPRFWLDQLEENPLC